MGKGVRYIFCSTFLKSGESGKIELLLYHKLYYITK